MSTQHSTSIYDTYNLTTPTNGYTYTTNTTSIPVSTVTTANSYIYSNLTPTTEWNHNTSTVKINGNADVDGDLRIKGKSITKILDKIEERLAIFEQNEGLEERWEELRELAERYKKLEKELLSKEQVWNILKK